MSKLTIERHISIKDYTVNLNGEQIFVADKELGFGKFAKQLYKDQGINHAKFFKMDKLSKLGFLASEIMLNNPEPVETNGEQTALVFANASSSLNNDKKYQETIKDIPSPAVFVYTLPNIVIGEISIKNGFKGEAAFFVQKQFDILFMENYIAQLFSDSNTEHCIAGWLEYDMEENHNAFMMLIQKNGSASGIEFNSENIQTL